MIAKRLINIIAADDAQKQCRKDAGCHRIDGHDGDCKTLAVVLVEKAERWIRSKISAS